MSFAKKEKFSSSSGKQAESPCELKPISLREGFALRYSWKKYVAALVLVAAVFISIPQPTHAQMVVSDPINAVWNGLKYVGDKVYNIGKDLLGEAGSIALHQAVLQSLNTIAYDSATWLGSGGAGQKPQYFTGNFQQELGKVGDAAAGNFIEAFGKQEGVDFCAPSLSAKISIGLGLANEAKPAAPECTASKMVQNWSNAISIGNSKDFLKKFSGYFDVNQNDLGIALSAQTSLLTAQQNAQLNSQLGMQVNGRYQENTNIAGDILGLPNQAQVEENISNGAYEANLGDFTGDALADAAGVFINQLAVTGLNTLKRKFTAYLSSSANNSSGSASALSNPNSQPANGGVASAQGALRKIVEPDFSSKTDLDILAELTTCNDSVFGGVGPTNCVIDNNFRQAISNQETVAQALADGSLKGTASFGFVMGGDSKPIEPAWNVGYPYRSLIILRKYSIIPVGWELAAQYIQNHAAAIGRTIDLNDLVACYDPSDSYKGYNDDGQAQWCQGLVDPTWVLKAPQNFCLKQGYGPQILNSQVVSQGTDEKQNKLPPKLSVTRTDTYCGDEQSCIQENDDGSCKNTGYCSNDKRIWKFGSTGSCNAEFNTCQTFSGGENGQVSYLKNTLQTCDANDAGCQEYEKASADGYAALTGNIDWTKNAGQIWLNKNATACDQSNEGCHQFLRFAAGAGTNLLINSDFSKDADGSAPANWSGSGNTVANPDPTGHAGSVVKITSSLFTQDWSSGATVSNFPQGFVMEPNASYTLSADVDASSIGGITIGIGREGSTMQTTSNTVSGWQNISLTLSNDSVLANEIKITGSGYVTNIKFEVGDNTNSPTNYTAYGTNAIYEKIMPDYLRYACYAHPDSGDFSQKVGAPAVCKNFASQCNQDEVGCDSYVKSNAANAIPIPAVVTSANVCPMECDGYNTYVRVADDFYPAKVDYLIPSTAKTCSGSSVGCHEFTSLASSSSNGETKEYYSYLRQCVQPEGDCADFYSWQGDSKQGQQLVKFSLKGNGTKPSVSDNEAATCNAQVFGIPFGYPGYNADCRQFYDQKGNISYALYSKTISCSASCTSYRLTADKTDNSGAQPTCLTGGVWSDSQNGCVYNVLAAESKTCTAADNGCSEFDGNSSANTQAAVTDSFENGTSGWSGGAIDSAAYIANNHSYLFSASISKNLSGSSAIYKGSTYTLTFLARSDNAAAVITANISNGSVISSFNGAVSTKIGEWNIYSLNLPPITEGVTPSEVLTIKTTGAVYIDNIELTKTADDYYLIDGSWNTPASCDQDYNKNPFPQYMLGCSSYNDRLGAAKYLHSFDHICSVVGCEAMVDTQNSNSPDADNSHGATTSVAADSVIYAVYDQDKLCDQTNKGCERLGLKNSYGTEATYKDTYFDNNPDKYNNILCGSNGVGCNLFTTDNTASNYFKDPGDAVCEWRQAAATTNGWGWYTKRVMRCGTNGALCAANKDCTGGTVCALEKNDIPCPTVGMKTIGQGGAGNEIMQPGSDGVTQWAGACSEDQSGCTEYIDPVSDFSSNLIYNGNFSQNVGAQIDNADGWTVSKTQKVDLEENTLYVLTAESQDDLSFSVGINSSVTPPPFYTLQPDNTFAAANGTVGVGVNNSILFYTSRPVVGAVITVSSARPGQNSKVTLKKSVVSYQLSNTVNKTSCNGVADPTKGCIWFNERAVSATGYQVFNANAWTKYDPLITGNNANSLIQVSPDRTCDQWLSCKSYVKDDNNNNVCFDIANCDRLDDSGNCANFTVVNPSTNNNRTYDSATVAQENPESIKNATGYTKIGWYPVNPIIDNKVLPNDLQSLGQMSQQGKNVIVPDGDFESYQATSTDGGINFVGNPSGWKRSDGASWTPQSANSSFSVVEDPATAQNEGVSYPMIGKAFLKYSATNDNSSASQGHFPESALIYVQPGQDYFLSYYIDTGKLGSSNLASSPAEVIVVDGDYQYTSYSQIINGWRLVTMKFRPSNKQIRLILGAKPNSTGEIYVDDIAISPVLQVRKATPAGTDTVAIPDLFSRQICRLFPQADSLSCDYYDDNGILQKGDRGYCLEYDRAPGNPNTCLLWWPIDKVIGSGIQSVSDKGYSGQMPLYYCIGSNIGTKEIVNGVTTNYPYIDANEVNYAVDEGLIVKVNGVQVNIGTTGGGNWLTYRDRDLTATHDDHYHSHGTLGANPAGDPRINEGGEGPEATRLDPNLFSNNIIPLKYGVNTIQVLFTASDSGGSSFFQMNGSYHYLKEDNSPQSKSFDFVDLFKQATKVGWDQNVGIPDGSVVMVHNDGGGNCASTKVSGCSYNDWANPYCGGGCITGINDCFDSKICGDGGTIIIDYNFNIPQPVCTELASVVDGNGRNKVWSDKIKDSTLKLDCNTGMPDSYTYSDNPLADNIFNIVPANTKSVTVVKPQCSLDTEPTPRGAANAPVVSGSGAGSGFINDPSLWGAKTGAPLPYAASSNAVGQMGQLYSQNVLSSLYAESEGVWDWVNGSYVLNTSENWTSPSTVCAGARTGNTNCAVAPTIQNFRLNGTTNALIKGRGFVNVTFNSFVDSQQLPLVSYEVDWGDGSSPLTVSGTDMSPRTNIADPHSVYHSYDYYDLLAKWNSIGGDNKRNTNVYTTLQCYPQNSKQPYCTLKPRVRLTDNWGVCTEGYNGAPCPITGVCSNGGGACLSNSSCGSGNCNDGWWESTGVITVNQP
jgi:hypothetical protein